MAHLLLIEAPGGNDFDCLDAALVDGHEITFLSGDLSVYARNGTLQTHLVRAKRVLEIPPFEYAEVERQIVAVHAHQPIDAVLCLLDVRVIDAARLAERLNLKFLNVRTARLMRDKFEVRRVLAAAGLAQPAFELALNPQQLRSAIDTLDLPVLVKPCDGYGSQNITAFITPEDLNPFLDPIDGYFEGSPDYGFGVSANGRVLVERYLTGCLVGCDTMTSNGEHVMLGINEKMLFNPPSAAIQGSVFPSHDFDGEAIRHYVFAVLDALHFNHGATHTEIMVTADGPRLVEVNPRLVGAKIPRLLSAAFGRSIHSDLIRLHLDGEIPVALRRPAPRVAVSRWIVADAEGTLARVELPSVCPAAIRHVEILKQPGESVMPPLQNADRIGYIMAVADDRIEAEGCAAGYLAAVKVLLVEQTTV